MTSIERLSMAGLIALSTGLGATGALYLRPLQPTMPPAISTPMAEALTIIRTVSWFRTHPDVMTRKLADCQDNPGVGQHDPECVNAEQAAENISFDRQIAGAK